jgi:hypothetical protein
VQGAQRRLFSRLVEESRQMGNQGYPLYGRSPLACLTSSMNCAKIPNGLSIPDTSTQTVRYPVQAFCRGQLVKVLQNCDQWRFSIPPFHLHVTPLLAQTALSDTYPPLQTPRCHNKKIYFSLLARTPNSQFLVDFASRCSETFCGSSGRDTSRNLLYLRTLLEYYYTLSISISAFAL